MHLIQIRKLKDKPGHRLIKGTTSGNKIQRLCSESCAPTLPSLPTTILKFAVSLILTLFSVVLIAQNDSCLFNVKLGMSFPPVTNATQRNFSKTHLDTLNVKLVRFSENWTLREATPGVYNWAPLGNRMDWITNNNYSLLLTIQSNGPDWACNPLVQNELSCAFADSVAFRQYIDTLLLLYGSDIDKIQFGNEWHSDYWYIGSAKDFIRAHNTVWESVQENADHIEVVLGGFASGTMTALAGCFGYLDSLLLPDASTYYYEDDIQAYCNDPENIKILQKQDSILSFCNYDIIDMHLYDDVELWPLYYHIMDSITHSNYPIIVSEMGGPNGYNELPYTDEFQAQRLYQYLKCVDSLNISEAYYFKLVDGGSAAPYHQESGLIDNATLFEKPAYKVFKNMNEECVSSTVDDFEKRELPFIFPNPSNTLINVDCKNGFKIYSSTGQMVKSSPHSATVIYISDLPKGLYILKTGINMGKFLKTE